MNCCRLVRPVECDNYIYSLFERVDKVCVTPFDISIQGYFLDFGFLLHLDHDCSHLNIGQFCAAKFNLSETIDTF